MIGRGHRVACRGRGLRSLCARGPIRGQGGKVRGLSGGDGRAGLPGRLPVRHRSFRQRPLLALCEGYPRVSRVAGPAVVAVVPLGGAIGVRRHCYPGRHAWRQLCPFHNLLVHQCCAVGIAVQCCAGGMGAGGRGGLAVVSAPCGQGPVVIYWHWGGRPVSSAAHTLRHRSRSGAGHRALGPRGLSGDAGGRRTRWTPVTAVTSCVRRKACNPSRASGTGRGRRGE